MWRVWGDFFFKWIFAVFFFASYLGREGESGIHNFPLDIFSHLHCMCSIPGFADSDEAPALDRLIETYQDREEEEFHECCDNAVFKTMDNEVQKLYGDGWVQRWPRFGGGGGGQGCNTLLCEVHVYTLQCFYSLIARGTNLSFLLPFSLSRLPNWRETWRNSWTWDSTLPLTCHPLLASKEAEQLPSLPPVQQSQKQLLHYPIPLPLLPLG